MKNKKAFTLIELIVSLAIVSLLVLIISSMLSLNFKISTKIYKSDFSYKEAANAMLYVENVVREAEKIEKTDNPSSNFKAFFNKSTYEFIFDEEEKKLKAKIKGTKGTGTVWLSSLEDLIFTYDGDREVFLWLKSLDGDVFQTRIDLGPRDEEESLY